MLMEHPLLQASGLPNRCQKTGSFKMADLYCGGGGTSTAILEAADAIRIQCQLTVWNHWSVAIETHKTNHPLVSHYCEDLNNVNPRKHFAENELDALWASPSCSAHSNAAGARPRDLDQTRTDPWCVLRWVHATLPKMVFLENVCEWVSWGPLDSKGRPIESRKGETFRAWIQAIESHGYHVEWRILCAADFGDPTTRKRFFLQAVRGKRKIVWPNPTHTSDPSGELFTQHLLPWVPAREIIDWTLPGTSIFERKHPLKPKTLARIEAGLRKFGLSAFLVQPGHADRSGERGDYRSTTLDQPIGTLPCSNRFALAEPFLIELRGTSDSQIEGSPKGINKPLGTVTAKGRHFGLIEPMLLPQQSGSIAQGVSYPAPTVGAEGAIGLVEPYLIHVNHQGGDRTRSVHQPLPTVCGSRGEIALCEPFLLKYFGTATTASINTPLDTVTTRDRFGLVRPIVILNDHEYELDIRFRMLQPHELALAQGFQPGYQFAGTKTAVVRQIGNAVPRRLARAIVAAALTQNPDAPEILWRCEQTQNANSELQKACA
jgi:DNA (cytosine-5)-methyltransferase 1